MHCFIFHRKPFYLPADLTPHSYILPVDKAVNIRGRIKMYQTACNISYSPIKRFQKNFSRVSTNAIFSPVSPQNRYQH